MCGIAGEAPLVLQRCGDAGEQLAERIEDRFDFLRRVVKMNRVQPLRRAQVQFLRQFAQRAQTEADRHQCGKGQQGNPEQEGRHVMPCHLAGQFAAGIAGLSDDHLEVATRVALPVIAPLFTLPRSFAVAFRRERVGECRRRSAGVQENAG